jgi:hypothetical protein
MKILAEAKKGFDVEKAIADVVFVNKILVKGTEAEGIELSIDEIFVALADHYKDVTFILLDDENKIAGWRN